MQDCSQDAFRNVLIIDDHPGVVAALATRLMAAGWECLTAVNGQDALRLLVCHRVDALVTDLDMPGTDGFTILQTVTTQGYCPALAMTGSADAAVECGERFPEVPVILKPFTADQVLCFLGSIGQESPESREVARAIRRS